MGVRVILIVPPIGYIPEWLIKDVAEFVDSYYSRRGGVSVKAGDYLSESLFLSAYHPFRRQFLGGAFLPTLSEIGNRREHLPQWASQRLTSTKRA